MNKKWSTQEQLAQQVGLTSEQVGIKLSEYGLKDPVSGLPTQAALSKGLVRRISGLFGPVIFSWNEDLVLSALRNDPFLQARLERYANEAIGLCRRTFQLVQAGRKDEATRLEVQFWDRVPEVIKPRLKEFLTDFMSDFLFEQQKKSVGLIEKQCKASADLLEFTPFSKTGIEEFLAELEGFCFQEGLLVISFGDKPGLSLPLVREDGVVKYGAGPEDKEMVIGSLKFALTAFLYYKSSERLDNGEWIREVRAYQVGLGLKGFFYKKIQPAKLRESYAQRGGPPENLRFV